MELEYEGTSAAVTVRFHLQCQSAWEQARLTPTALDWIRMEEQPPPLRAVVEARLDLGASRSVVLSIMRVQDAETGATVWMNANTQAPLPQNWRPLEWRALPGAKPVDAASAAEMVAPKRA